MLIYWYQDNGNCMWLDRDKVSVCKVDNIKDKRIRNNPQSSRKYSLGLFGSVWYLEIHSVVNKMSSEISALSLWLEFFFIL